VKLIGVTTPKVIQINPIGLVEVRGISKRRRQPADLTVDQVFLVLDLLPDPYYTMGLVALCTGMRADELLALSWHAIDFNRLCMKIEEGVVNERIGPVKTEYSDDELPLDPDFATILLEWKLKSNGSELVFPNPIFLAQLPAQLALPLPQDRPLIHQ
jgi:integrase